MGKMDLGIYTPEIQASSLDELFFKIKQFGFSQTQFSLFSCGFEDEVPNVPISDAKIAECKQAAQKHGVSFFVLNGTYNMSHSDTNVRAEGAKSFFDICRVAHELNCPVVSLCTGTRNRDSMWIWHTDNETKEAWRDMVTSVEQAIEAAEKYDVVLGLETEASNVCNTTEKVRRLIRDMQSDRLRVIMDCANLFHAGEAHREKVHDVIQRGFDCLGEYVVVAHGKDVKEGDGIDFTYSGNGIVDFPFFLEELKQIGYIGGMILHGTKAEAEIPPAVRFLRSL